MRCSCVCGGELEDGAFSVSKVRTARKEYVCGECDGTIHKGQKYEHRRGFNGRTELAIKGAEEVRWWTARTCETCLKIRDLFCDGWTTGQLFDDIYLCLNEINLSALEDLPKAGRDKFFEQMALGDAEEECWVV